MSWLRSILEKIKRNDLPVAYTVRYSPQAKYLRLRIVAGIGLEIVLPRGCSASRAAQAIKANQVWIMRHKEQIEHAAGLKPNKELLPEQIHLQAANKSFTVGFDPHPGRPPFLHMPDARRIIIQADPQTEAQACFELLHEWLKDQGRKVLVPWAYSLSQEHKLPIARVQVRRQKTRWASFSTSGTLSLNCHLMFLDSDLVCYVLLHELCHVRHPNHGPAFKAMLTQLFPQRVRYEQELQNMHQAAVPWWAKL
ncbi:MAG: YgjP-like metallopeptidase domain-containing protein [Desulfovermiculus sp.]